MISICKARLPDRKCRPANRRPGIHGLVPDWLFVTLAGLTLWPTAKLPAQVELKRDGDKTIVALDGDPFTEYDPTRWKKPVFYPVYGPDNVTMTRNFPMKRVPGEADDHPHHKSIWFAHGDVNGADFWSEKATIRHIRYLNSHDDHSFTVLDEWLDPETDRPIVRCRGTFSFGASNDCRWIDFEYTLKAAADQDVVFGDTKEGTFAVRTHPALRLRPDPARGVTEVSGQAINSEGIAGTDVWGKSARWIDYSGTIDGHVCGIAIFDHPDNLRHPTTWHAREYGLVAANPFGLHYFQQKPQGAGDWTLKAGQPATFRYGVVLHRGTHETFDIESAWRDFVARSGKK